MLAPWDASRDPTSLGRQRRMLARLALRAWGSALSALRSAQRGHFGTRQGQQSAQSAAFSALQAVFRMVVACVPH